MMTVALYSILSASLVLLHRNPQLSCLREKAARGRKHSTELHSSSKQYAKIDFGTKEFWDLCSTMEDDYSPSKSITKQVIEILKNSNTNQIEWNLRDCTTTAGDGRSLLHYACMQGTLDVVKFCLENGAEPNLATFTYESTPLKWASSKGFTDIVNVLLEYGADRNARDFFGYTPLQYACLGGHSDVAAALTGLVIPGDQSIPNIAAGDDDGGDHSNDKLIQDTTQLLKLFSEDEDINAIDETGFMPLHIACSIGRADIVTALLELGAFADEPTEEGRTPLFFAAGCGHDHIIEILLEWGAYVQSYTKTEKTYFHVATPAWTALHEACDKNQVQCATVLLSKGADVNVFNDGRETPLMVSTQKGHLETSKLLIENNADVNLGDDWNTTPLHTACRQNHKLLVSFLIEHGANVNSFNNYNETPLHHACWLGRMDIVQILVENGADTEVKNKDNQTPLDYARDRKHGKLLPFLGTRNKK